MSSNTKEYARLYRMKHQEKNREYRRHYYMRNRDKVLKKHHEYYQHNKDKCLKQNQEYRKRKGIHDHLALKMAEFEFSIRDRCILPMFEDAEYNIIIAENDIKLKMEVLNVKTESTNY